MNAQFMQTAEHPMDPAIWFRMHGANVAKLIPTDFKGKVHFDLKILKKSTSKMVMQVGANGDACIVKAYNSSQVNQIRRFRRELPVLVSLKGLDLTPRLYGYDWKNAYYVTEKMDGNSVPETLKTQYLEKLCHKIGVWFQRYNVVAAVEQKDTDWYTYLSKYAALANLQEFAQHAKFLKQLPIATFSIAKNDADLSNFVLDAEGGLRGIDFEAASYKPLGWDILLTARMLAKIAPDHFESAVDSLLDGWGGGAGPVSQDSFKALILCFSQLAKIQISPLNRPITDFYLARFNAQSDCTARAAFVTPFAESQTVRPKRADVALLRRHVWKHAEAALEDSSLATQTATQEGAPTAKSLATFCGACRGHCCKKGLKKHGYLTSGDINRTHDLVKKRDSKAVSDYYLSFLPVEHVKNSCLFHAASGCTLPDEVKSSKCRSYACRPAQDFTMATSIDKLSTPVLLVSSDADGPRRAELLADGKLSEVNVDLLTGIRTNQPELG